MRCLAMGFHPSKARLPGQFLVLDPSILRGALHALAKDDAARRRFLDLAREWREMAADYEELCKRAEGLAELLRLRLSLP